MKITSIAVTAARGFNHPHESYANFRFDLHLSASLADGEDAAASLLALQQQAETAADEHKARILADIQRKREIASVVNDLEFERRKAFDNEASKKRITDLEARLNALTSTPLLLDSKQIHPGHPDHPATNEDEDRGDDVGF